MSHIIESDSKISYTPEEFASCFGKSKYWAYRQIRLGRVHPITGYGDMIIPHSELERILNDKSRYMGRKPSTNKQGGKL
jgi:hypothetical protein